MLVGSSTLADGINPVPASSPPKPGKRIVQCGMSDNDVPVASARVLSRKDAPKDFVKSVPAASRGFYAEPTKRNPNSGFWEAPSSGDSGGPALYYEGNNPRLVGLVERAHYEKSPVPGDSAQYGKIYSFYTPVREIQALADPLISGNH
jgi:hypothetical protein